MFLLPVFLMELCLTVKLDDSSRLFGYYSSFFLFVFPLFFVVFVFVVVAFSRSLVLSSLVKLNVLVTLVQS